MLGVGCDLLLQINGTRIYFYLPKKISFVTTALMSFEPAGNFLFIAAKKYNLESQAIAGIICECVRKFIVQEFSEFSQTWEPIKFDSGALTIQVSDAAAGSALFLRTYEIMELLALQELPAVVEQILIVRRT